MKFLKTFVAVLVLMASAMLGNVKAANLFVGTSASASYQDEISAWHIVVNDDKGNTIIMDIDTGGPKKFAGTYSLSQCNRETTGFKGLTGQALFTDLSVTISGTATDFSVNGTGVILSESGRTVINFLYGVNQAELEELEQATATVNVEGPATTSIVWNMATESWVINMPGNKAPALKLDIKTGLQEKFAGTYTLVDCNANNTKHGTKTFSVLTVTITGTPNYCEITGKGKRSDGVILAFHYASPKPQDIDISGVGMAEGKYDGSAWTTSVHDYVHELSITYRAAASAFAGTYTLANCVKASLMNYNTNTTYSFIDLWFEIKGEPGRAREVNGQGTLDNGAEVLFSYVDSGEEVKISSAGYITYYCSDKNIQVPNGVEGYVAYMNGDDFCFEKLYESMDVIPAGTPVVLKGQGSAMLMYSIREGKTPAHNDLRGSDYAVLTTAPELGECYYYALTRNAQKEDASVGFYWMNATGDAFTNQPHRAYLAVPKSAAARMSYLFADEATGLAALEAKGVNAPAYNLRGQHTQAAQGLLIREGKMMFVK